MKRIIISMLTAAIMFLLTIVSSVPSLSFSVSAADATTVTIEGQSIFANGHPIIIRGGTGGNTLIYVDKGIIGTYEDGIDIVAELSGPAGNTTNGYDLSTYKLFGGNRSSANSTRIVMQGGTIGQVFGGGLDGSVNGDTNIEISGGSTNVFGGGEMGPVNGNTRVKIIGGNAFCVFGGGRYNSAPVTGSTFVEISGGNVYNVYGGDGGGGTVGGDTNVKISGVTVNNVYGGGESGSVTGNTSVKMNGVNAHWVFGGGENGSVNGNSDFKINGGSVYNVFGGAYNSSVGGNASVEISGARVDWSVFGGSCRGNVEKIAHVKIYADTIVSGYINVISSADGTIGSGSYAECEVAFYDGATKLASPAPQWIKISENGNATNNTVTQPAALTSTEKIFNAWKNIDNSEYNFSTVISKPLKLYASWTAIPTYTATVTNGTGDGSYAENATVSITADSPSAGKVFDKWTTSDGVTFADAASTTTTFEMPAKAVTVTATYKDVPAAKTIEIVETPADIKNPNLIFVKPNGEAFTQSVEVRIKEDPTVKKAIEDSLDSVIKGDLKDVTVFPLDISLYIKGTDTKVQPKEGTSVEITIPIPESLLVNKDKIKVVCIIDGKLTVLETKIFEIDGVWCVQFTATHFSPYAMVINTTNVLSNAGKTPTPEKPLIKTTTTTNPKTNNNNAIVPIFAAVILSLSTLVVVGKSFSVEKKNKTPFVV